MDVLKKKYPILDENNQPSAYPTFGSQVFGDDEKHRALWQNGVGFYADDTDRFAGKEQSYYTNPVNLLVNSNFSNPVVSFAADSSTKVIKEIDRWKKPGVNTEMSLQNGYVKVKTIVGSQYAQISQVVENILKYKGKPLTFAASVRSDVTIRIGYSLTTQNMQEIEVLKREEPSKNNWKVIMGTIFIPNDIVENGLEVTIVGESTGVGNYIEVEWAALYDGSYSTEDSLPPYAGTNYRVESLKSGKPVQPKNLVDNSNFIIAQAGYGANHGTIKYAADRWLMEANNDLEVSKDEKGLSIRNTGTVWYRGIKQKVLLDNPAGKTYTIAVSCQTSNRMRITGLTLADQNFIGVNSSIKGTGKYATYTLQVNVPEDYTEEGIVVGLSPDCDLSGEITTGVVICMYEGAYTTETVPPYVPKGYATELAECRRYYENSWFNYGKNQLMQITGTAWSNNQYDCPIYFQQTKRTNPTMMYYPAGRSAIQGYINGAYRDVTVGSTQYLLGRAGVYARVKSPQNDMTAGYSYTFHAHWEASADL